MRSPDARDAATPSRARLEGRAAAPARPADLAREPAGDRADGVGRPADGWGIDWASIAIGVAASLLLVAGLVAPTGQRIRRPHRPRVAA